MAASGHTFSVFSNGGTTTAMSFEEAKQWFFVFKPLDTPQGDAPMRRARLICFPWASSNGMVFRQLGLALSSLGIELAALMLPGRSLRHKEPLETDMSIIVGKCFVALRTLGWLDGSVRTVFFGHSFGGILAFELTRRIERETAQAQLDGSDAAASSYVARNAVSHLMVSAVPTPHIMQVFFSDITNCNHCNDDKLRALMKGDGQPAVDERLVQFAMPILRADCKAFERYAFFGIPWPHWSPDRAAAAVPDGTAVNSELDETRPLPTFDECFSGRAVRPEHRVRCPITALGGCRDSVVSRERITPWVFYSEHGPDIYPYAEIGDVLPDALVDEPVMRPGTRSDISPKARRHPGAVTFLDPSGHHFYLADPAGGADWTKEIITQTCLLGV